MAGTKNTDFEQFENYKNCFVNAKAKKWLQSEETVISHYMPYVRLEQWINDSIMTFVSPSKWSDPFEKIYLNTALINLPSQKKYTPPRIACICFTKSQYKDSVAFWKNFKPDELTQLVRVEFSFRKTLDQIIKVLKDYNMKLYVVAVDYRLQQKTIKNEISFIRHIKDNSRKIDGESLFVKLLSYKRKSYSYEREIRTILVPQKGKIPFDDRKCFTVDGFDYESIVENVWLEPVQLPSGWVSKETAKERLNVAADKIKQSFLYEEQKACEKIDWRKISKTKKD